MTFYFVPDFRKRYRFFSSEPVQEIQVRFSRWKKIWDEAKRRLLLLPPRILRQEQAFEAILRHSSPRIEIIHALDHNDKKIRRRFFFFLQKQRSRHVALLIGEALLLPVSGLMAMLPGPNIFFGILGLIMVAHWQGLRGINRLVRISHEFQFSPLLGEWTAALEAGKEQAYSNLLAKIEKECGLTDLHKILYR